jgi:glycosyltransferase involved in cell wall biosynthesis
LDPAATRIVRYADVESLARALREVLGNPGVRIASEGAAPRIREVLSWDAVAVRQHQIYEELLRSG